MAYTGQTITNTVTLETVRFIRTSRDDGGARLEMEFIVPAGGSAGGAGAHFHPRQTETFSILEGRARFSLGRNTVEVDPGSDMTVVPGAPHFWSAITDVRMLVTQTPGYGGEDYFEKLFAMISRRGSLSLFDLAVLDSQHPRLGYPAGLPALLWRPALLFLSVPGRLLGYGPQPGDRHDGPPS